MLTEDCWNFLAYFGDSVFFFFFLTFDAGPDFWMSRDPCLTLHQGHCLCNFFSPSGFSALDFNFGLLGKNYVPLMENQLMYNRLLMFEIIVII